MGVVARDRIGRSIALFDIALQPMVVSYASPLKLLEYLAMGRAIVAPNTPNIRELLTDGQNAVLFDPQDLDSMRNAIKRLAADAELRQRLGRTAKETIHARGFTRERNALRVTAIMENLIAN